MEYICTYMLEYVGDVSGRIPKIIVRVRRGKHTGELQRKVNFLYCLDSMP